MSNGRADDSANDSGADDDGRSVAEWTTFLASCVILATVLALIVVQMRGRQDPAAPAATIAGEARQVGGQFHVAVEVDNSGDRTAQNVQVTAELTHNGTTTSGDQTIDFLAGGESTNLVFVFDENPATGELTVTVSGYAEP